MVSRAARVAFADERLEVAGVAIHQVGQGDQVVRHPPQDLVLFQVLGDRHLHGAVEGELALVDLLEDIDDQGQREVALQHLATEPLAGDLDPLGQVDFLVAGQERNLAHLGQIHADRVVDAPRDLVEILGGELGFLVLERLLDEVVIGFVIQIARGEQAVLRLVLVDQLDAHLVERLEQTVDALRARRLVGQIVVDLVERQKATTFAQVEKRFEALVQLVHPNPPSRTIRRISALSVFFVSGRWLRVADIPILWHDTCRGRRVDRSPQAIVSSP